MNRYESQFSNTSGRNSSVRKSTKVTGQFQESSKFRNFHQRNTRRYTAAYTGAIKGSRETKGFAPQFRHYGEDAEQSYGRQVHPESSDSQMSYNLADHYENFYDEEFYHLTFGERIMNWLARHLQTFRTITIAMKLVSVIIYVLRQSLSLTHYDLTGDYYKENWPKWTLEPLRENLLNSMNMTIFQENNNSSFFGRLSSLDESSIPSHVNNMMQSGTRFQNVMSDFFQNGFTNETRDYLYNLEFLNDFESLPEEQKQTTKINPNWNSNTDFDWKPIIFVHRADLMFQIQCFCAWVAVLYMILDYILIYYFYDIYMIFDKFSKSAGLIMKELFVTIPFILAGLAQALIDEDHFLKEFKYIWLPVYLNLTFIRDELQDMFESFIKDENQQTETRRTMLKIEILFIALEVSFLISHVERVGRCPSDFGFINSIWFLIVSLVTIGYGDISPTTWLSKLIMVYKGMGFYRLLIKKYRLYQSMRRYTKLTGGIFTDHSKDEFVIFSTTTYSEDVLADFMKEFYSVDYNRHITVLIISHEDYSDEIKESIENLVLENSVARNQVKYFRGSLINENDLDRLSARQSEACFIVTARSCHDSIQEDQRTIMRAIHFRTYAPGSPLYVHVLRIRSKSRIGFAETIMCDEEMYHAMFALNTRIPGISTAIVCMCHTIEDRDHYDEDNDMELDEWEEHIKRSVELEIYDTEVIDSRIFLPFVGKSFPFVSYQCYHLYSVTLIGVSREGRMIANPGKNFFLRTDDILYYISRFDECEIPDGIQDQVEDRSLNLTQISSKDIDSRKSLCLDITSESGIAHLDAVIAEENCPSGIELSSEEENQIEESVKNEVSNLPSKVSLKENPNSGTLLQTQPGFPIDFPPFCPVVDRCVLHVACHLSEDYAQDIPTIREQTRYQTQTFTNLEQSPKREKYKLGRPIIVISESELAMGVFNLITHLRSVNNTQGKIEVPIISPIIFLTTVRPDDVVLRSINRFPEIYYHIGDCTNIDDLIYVNAYNAEVLIYLGTQNSKIHTGTTDHEKEQTKLQEVLFDRAQIINILSLEQLFPKVRLLACMKFSGNLKFLDSDPESILANEMGNGMLAQAKQSHDSLLNHLAGTNSTVAKLIKRRNSRRDSSVARRQLSQNTRDRSFLSNYSHMSYEESGLNNHSSYANSFIQKNEHKHLRYLYKETFTSGKTFTMSMFDTLLYQSFNKPYLPELLKLILGLTYSFSSGKLCTYRIDDEITIGMTYGKLFKEFCGGENLHGNQNQPKVSLGGKKKINIKKQNSTRSKALPHFRGLAIPLGLYRMNPNLRETVNEEANRNRLSVIAEKINKGKNQLMKSTTVGYKKNVIADYDTTLATESKKSERQLIDEYLEKRTEELFGEYGDEQTERENKQMRKDKRKKKYTGENERYRDVNSGYVIMSPASDLVMCKGDIVYILKAHSK